MPRIALLIALSVLPALPAGAQDAREAAVRTEAERLFILDQMRLFLQSTQAIVAALAEGDRKTVAEEAAARGRRTAPALAMPPGLKAKETPAWTAMMSGARAGFADLAAAALAGAPTMQLTRTLGDTMRNCVACHQSYRLTAE